MILHRIILLLSYLFCAEYCNAEITSSLGRFTFCPGDNVTLTCSMTSLLHVWESSAFVTAVTIAATSPIGSSGNGNINFLVTNDDGTNALTSTMTFTATEALIGNETLISCSSASSNVPGRATSNVTVSIFGRTSPPHMPSLTRATGDYKSLTLTFLPPLYGHECVIGYSVIGQSKQTDSDTTTIVITQLNLCQTNYTFSLFARSISGNGSEVSISSDIPDFEDLGRVSNLSVSNGYLQWSPPPNAPDDCISGYTIQWPTNGVFKSGNATNISVSTLNSETNGTLPFCVKVSTVVIPSVPVVSSPLNVSQNDPAKRVVYQLQTFPKPSVISSPGNNEIDTVVSWQDTSSFTSGDISTSVGIYDGECQVRVMNISGQSQFLGSECSKVGQNVQYCVLFQFDQCNSTGMSSRQLPSFSETGVGISKTTINSIELQVEFIDISGSNCSVDDLGVSYALLQNNEAIKSDTRDYTPMINDFAFTGLASDTSYNYQINITQDDIVVATFSGTATTSSPGQTAAIAAASVSVVGVAGGTTTVVIIVVVVIIKKKKRKDDSETHELNKMEDQKSPDSHVEHLHAPTGEEYAVVEKKKHPKSAQPTESQALYQDPNTIEHEVAPATGDIYAVTEKKPKKKKGSQSKPTEDELSQMYSVPDKARKNAGGLTYAEIDMGGRSGKPVSPVLQTEYATVVT